MQKYLHSINENVQARLNNWIEQVSEQQGHSVAGKFNKSAALKLINIMVGRSIPFASRNGFKVIDFRPGYIKALIPLKPNKNHFNAMYAGALFTVTELPGGIISSICFDKRFFPILKDLKIDFIRVAKSDVTVEFEIAPAQLKQLESEASEQGKSSFVLEGKIKDIDDVVVATSYANYQIRLRNS